MNKTIAILGGGNGGITAAADLSSRGFHTSLFELPEFFSNVQNIKKNGGIKYKTQDKEKFISINLITDSIAEALRGASIVMLTVPSPAIETFAKLAAPHLQEGTKILLNGATAMSSYRFTKVVKEIRGDFPFSIGETASLTYASRVEKGEVNVSLVVKNLLFAAYPSTDTKTLLDTFKKIYPSLVAAKNVWETLLHNGNPETHAGPSLLNAGRIEYSKGEFYLYKEGITPMVSNVIKAISLERKLICEALEVNYRTTSERMIELGYSDQQDELYRMYNNSKVFRNIKGPLSLASRYFVEDIFDGLVLWSSLGEKLNVPTPIIDAIITLYGTIVGKDFTKEGLTLEKLGLSTCNLEELKQIV